MSSHMPSSVTLSAGRIPRWASHAWPSSCATTLPRPVWQPALNPDARNGAHLGAGVPNWVIRADPDHRAARRPGTARCRRRGPLHPVGQAESQLRHCLPDAAEVRFDIGNRLDGSSSARGHRNRPLPDLLQPERGAIHRQSAGAEPADVDDRVAETGRSPRNDTRMASKGYGHTRHTIGVGNDRHVARTHLPVAPSRRHPAVGFVCRTRQPRDNPNHRRTRRYRGPFGKVRPPCPGGRTSSPGSARAPSPTAPGLGSSSPNPRLGSRAVDACGPG